jgi:hypothetical protein
MAFHKVCIDLNWKDSIEEGDNPALWPPYPLNEGVINGFIRDVKAKPQANEIYRQSITSGKSR